MPGGNDCQPVLPRERMQLPYDAGMRLLQAHLCVRGTVYCKLWQWPGEPIQCVKGCHIVDEQQSQSAFGLHNSAKQANQCSGILGSKERSIQVLEYSIVTNKRQQDLARGEELSA